MRTRSGDDRGGNNYVYLFKTPAVSDQSAGKDYVDYDFNLTGLANGETLLEDYGHYNSPNPEDSTVKTANYELHSTDRWMEDEMRISTAGASATDILDREAVSAGGLGGCGRSEYTFSGNWDMDVNPGNDRPTMTTKAPTSRSSTDRCGRSVPTWAPTAALTSSRPTSTTPTTRTSRFTSTCGSIRFPTCTSGPITRSPRSA